MMYWCTQKPKPAAAQAVSSAARDPVRRQMSIPRHITVPASIVMTTSAFALRLQRTSDAIRRRRRSRRTLSGRLDEGMEHADAELARILAGPAADLHRDERLVDGDLDFGRLPCPELIGLDRNAPEEPFLWHQIEFVE